jgi:flagellar biosynthesis anti-sigma factor FlgM
MTSSITSLSQNAPTPEGGQAGRLGTVKSSPQTGAGALTASQPGEAVTLSAAAQITTQLLDAARVAPGLDSAAVTQARAAIQSGTYNVSPQDLAGAITAAFKELPR